MATTIQEMHFKSKPFFAVDDDAYARMETQLKTRQSVRTYMTVCPHKSAKTCKCPYFNNIMKDGMIMREWNGQIKPVFSKTTFLEMFPDVKCVYIGLGKGMDMD